MNNTATVHINDSKPKERLFGNIALCVKNGSKYKKVKSPIRNGWWEIECEPHVMMRIKRTFGRSDSRSFGKLHLRDTDEVCRDLLWFTSRFPMNIEHYSYMVDKAEEHEKREEEFHFILSGEIKPQEFKLAIPPREYQAIAAELWLKSKGLLCADDLGLGKTLVGIAGITKPELRPALVVTMTHLPAQWEREIQRFAPGLKTHIIKTGKVYDICAIPKRHRVSKEQKKLFDDSPRFPDVLIINYHKLSIWAETLAPKIRSIVFDECQELRINKSNKWAAAKYIADNAEFKLGCSGTPVYNYGGEMFNITDVLRPGILGTAEEFLREWCEDGYDTNGKGGRVKDPKAFGSYLREQGIMVRRTRKEVKRELPGLIKIPHHVDSDMKALNEVSDSVAELAKIILSNNAAFTERGKASRELDWKLRQATGIAKAPYIAEFVKMLVESEGKVVLYAWHREVYKILEDRLRGFNPVFYTGTETPVQKEKSRASFCSNKSDSAKILIMSLRSGAGLDGLQYHTHTVVHAELDWSPKIHDQCDGRVYRDGQEEPVISYYLISDEGSDPVVADVLGIKRQQISGIQDPDASLIEKANTDPDRIKRLAEAYLKKSSDE